jgi:hypothetical protein
VIATHLFTAQQTDERVETVLVPQTDTVFVEKIQWREKVLWRERLVYRDKPTHTAPMAVQAPSFETNEIIELQSPEISQPHIGTSMGEAPELMGFFTQGDH